jgi:transposase InsO family protein
MVLGEATFPITVGGLEFMHTIIVAQALIGGIVGMDFMNLYQVCIDLKNGTVSCDGQNIPATMRGYEKRCCRIMVSETTTIRAGHRMLVQGKTSHAIPAGNWLIEPLSRPPDNKPLLVAKALVRGDGIRVPLEVMNPTEQDIVLYKNTNAALLQPVKLITELQPISVDRETETSRAKDDEIHHIRTMKLKPELEKLYKEIQHPLDEAELKAVRKLLLKHQDAFQCEGEPLGRTNVVKHDINTSTSQPMKQKARRFPIHQRGEGEKIVQEMLEGNVIEPSTSPWASPVVLVKKKDGSTRFCIDYRKLNSVTIKDAYPLPRIDESLDALSGAQFFSTLDLASGYWQVGMTEEAKLKSAFATPSGLFQFKCMPFGLCNAPSTFERLMEQVLAGLQWQICLIYLDDVIIFSKTCAEHIARLDEILSKLGQAGLKLKPKKCHFFCEEVLYLGHRVSKEGIATDPDKVKAVQNWGVPTNLTDVRSFLGLCSYYRRFIPQFSTIAKPLTRLTEKNQGFKWGDEQEEAWAGLKQKLLTAPILAYPDPQVEFIVDTDASAYGIGAVLSQVQNGQERVIAYGSRSLTKEERRYCVTRQELLAIVYFLKYFRHYLYGRHFTVRTDHGALRWLINFKDPQGQVARWLEVLGTFDFDVEHRPGLKHNNADAMSRGPCRQCGRDESEEPNDCDKREEPDECLAITRSKTKQTVVPVPVAPPHEWVPWTGEGPLSRENLVRAQADDPVIAQLLGWKRDGRKPVWSEVSAGSSALKTYWAQWESLVVYHSLLCRELCLAGKKTRKQVLVPAGLQDTVLDECHNAVTAGHMGIRRTLAGVRTRFFWPKLRDAIQKWISRCAVCASRKPSLKKRRGPLQRYMVGEPMERVALDVSGPWPLSESGNKYILVVTDHLTRWSEAYPIADQEARTISEVFVTQFIARFGCPMLVHTDQGRNFESKLFKEMCVMLGVKKTHTMAFRPQSNGIVERMNKTIGSLISAYVSENQRTWDKNLAVLMMAYRATPHETSGLTPNELMLGRQISMPIDIQVGLPPESEPREENQYLIDLRVRMEEAYAVARENLMAGAERQKRYYDLGADEAKFQPGDLVWLLNQSRRKGRCPKLQRKWLGPMIVEARVNDVTYKLRVDAQNTRMVHFEKIKPYLALDIPRWMVPVLNRMKA